MQQTPVSLQNPTAKSSQAYEEMAYKLVNKEEVEKQPRRGMAAFFSHIVNARRMI